MNKKILISENERSRILGLHENRRMKEWGLINEEMIYIKDANGKASMFNGSIPPIGSTKIDKVEFDAINKLLGTAAAPVTPAPAPVTPAPAPFIPNGYDSIDACKATYNTSFLYGISMKVLGQNHLAIQKKWISSGCNSKTPCDKTAASNKNLAMAICEGTFNMSGPVVTPLASNASTVTPPASNASTVTEPINTLTLLDNELKAKNIKITGLFDPPPESHSNWSLTDGSRINAGYYGVFSNEAEDTSTHYMDNGMTLKSVKKNTSNPVITTTGSVVGDELDYAKLPNWTDKPIAGAKTTVRVVTEPMKALTPTSVSSTATQLGLNGATGETPQLATGPMRSGQEIRQDYRQQQQDFRKQNRLSNQNRRQLERELKQLQNDLRSNLANRMSAKDKTDRTNRITQIQTELAQA